MPLGKDDAPDKDKAASSSSSASKADTEKAVEAAIDEGAGAPAPQQEAAEALPEKDDQQKAHKDAALAETAQDEAKAKAKEVELSPDAAETPSGAALLKTAGIADDVERGEAYAREKSAVRWGYVHPSLDKDK